MRDFFSLPVKQLINKEFETSISNEISHECNLLFDSNLLIIKSNDERIILFISRLFNCIDERAALSAKDGFLNSLEIKFDENNHFFSVCGVNRKVSASWDELSLYFVVRDDRNFILQAGSWNRVGRKPFLGIVASTELKDLISSYIEREVIISLCNPDRHSFFHGVHVEKGQKRIFILGESGVGKSTIASIMNVIGWTVINDDIIPFDRKESVFIEFPKKTYLNERSKLMLNKFEEQLELITKLSQIEVKRSKVIILLNNQDSQVGRRKLGLQEFLDKAVDHIIIRKSKETGIEIMAKYLPVFSKLELYELNRYDMNIEAQLKNILNE